MDDDVAAFNSLSELLGRAIIVDHDIAPIFENIAVAEACRLGIPIVGAILNDVDSSGPYRYYTYSYSYEAATDDD